MCVCMCHIRLCVSLCVFMQRRPRSLLAKPTAAPAQPACVIQPASWMLLGQHTSISQVLPGVHAHSTREAQNKDKDWQPPSTAFHDCKTPFARGYTCTQAFYQSLKACCACQGALQTLIQPLVTSTMRTTRSCPPRVLQASMQRANTTHSTTTPKDTSNRCPAGSRAASRQHTQPLTYCSLRATHLLVPLSSPTVPGQQSDQQHTPNNTHQLVAVLAA